VFVQVPVEALSVLPSVALPLIVGGAVFAGGVGGGGGTIGPLTVPVRADVAEAEPAALRAVTETRRVEPTSAAPRR
jgi:hypothetical protein